jgi:hypothetical protein
MSLGLRTTILAAFVIAGGFHVSTRAEPRPRFLLCDTPLLGEVRIEIGGFYKSVGAARKHCIDELNGVPTGLVYE